MQLLIHLPDDLGTRFKEAVPIRSRSAFVKRLIESALPPETDPLYLLGLQCEREEAELDPDLRLWDQASGDGLGDL